MIAAIKPEGEVRIFVYNKNNELKEKRVQKCKSFTRWAKRNIYANLRKDSIVIRDLTGVDFTYASSGFDIVHYHWREDIKIGSNNSPFDFEQHALLGEVTLEVIQAISTTGYTEEDGTGYWESSKIWTADMAVDIWETGLVGRFIETGGGTRAFLITRDVLPSPVSLAVGDVIKVVYRIRI